MAVFEDFVFSGVASRIEARLDFYRRAYYAALDEAENTRKLAEVMLNSVFPKKLMNCRVMASRIIAYDLKEVNDRLTRYLDGFFNFLLQSYKGLYCSACNAFSHAAFNKEARSFDMSDGYCRSFVAHSLHFLYYFHLKIVPLFNLLIKFAGSCRGDGTFQEYFITPQTRFEESKETKVLLDRCTAFAGEPTWLIHCQGVCEKFDFFEWDEFFSPNLGKLIEATYFLEEKRGDILNSEPRLRIVLVEEHFKFDEGVDERRAIGLNTTQPLNHTAFYELQARLLAMYSVDTGLLKVPANSKLGLDGWRLRFIPGGMELYEEGSQTDLDMAKFQHLQTRYPEWTRADARTMTLWLATVMFFWSLFARI
jgi:hypothetical protein